MELIVKYLLLIFYLPYLDGVRFRCDYRYTYVGWFKYHYIPATWNDARLQCSLEGGVLASPTTVAIKSAMMQSICKTDIFTGIHATFSKGQYHTIDGIPLGQIQMPNMWASFEPDNNDDNESCIALNSDGKLSDVRCDKPRPYICYRENSNIDVTVCGTPDSEYHFESRTNKCYKFHTIPRTFARAHFACSAEGGHLAIINSEEEANIIRELFALYPATKMVGNFLKDVAFIGFHDWGEGGDWRTIHGQTLQEAGYATFSKGQPDNTTEGEYCGSVFRDATLNDVWCERHFAFICEKRPDYPAVCDNAQFENISNYSNFCDDNTDGQRKLSSSQSYKTSERSTGPVY